MKKWFITLALTLSLLALASTAGAVPVLDPLTAQTLLVYHANNDPFPDPVIFDQSYFWHPELDMWTTGNNLGGYYGSPDRDDHIIIMPFPVPVTLGSEERVLVVLAATFEGLKYSQDLAASASVPVPTPEPATLLLLGTGLVGLGWYGKRRRSAV